MERQLTLILAATSPTRGIGFNGGLPWRLSREMKFFRQVTMGGIVLMGRRTWESIPTRFRPLKGRTNVVISTSSCDFGPEVLSARSIPDALAAVKELAGPVFIIGGAQLYHAALELPQTTRVLLTEIHDPAGSLECDTFFTFGLDEKKWLKQSPMKVREAVGESVELPPGNTASESGLDFEFTVWEKTP